MGREIEIETPPSLFDEKMKKPQTAARSKQWQDFKKFFEEDKNALVEPFDFIGNTAIHAAIRSDCPKLLTQLLDMVPARDSRWRVLRKKNGHQNTLLHQVVFCTNVEMADVVLKYEKELPPPPDEEKQLPLLEFRNDNGETPLFRAAKHGNLSMLKHLAKHVTDIQKHFQREADKHTILHVAVLGQFFDVAIWLLRVDDRLANEEDDRGLTCLQLLSKMPYVFRSQSRLGTTKEFIYYLLPEKGYDYDDNDKSMKILTWGRDLESGEEKGKKHISVISRINYAIWKTLAQVISRINYAIWKTLAQEWDEIDAVWHIKKQHKLAEELADILVKKDNSWQNKFSGKRRTIVVMPLSHPSNIAAEKKELKKKENLSAKEKEAAPTGHRAYTPLLLAASTGIVEIVEKILDHNPEAINHVSEDEENIMHVTVKYRQMKIYRILKRYGALRQLASRITNKGRTHLHHAAMMDFYGGGNNAGYAFQLQDELRWFQRVKKTIPPYFVMHCDDDNLTASEQLEIEHADMLKEAQIWIKQTAQSCSSVAVLVATVVFAAAYTVPGGNNPNGLPIFLSSPVFLFFTTMDVVALASSLASVVMFLSILTSPFDMWDFHKSLPRKLRLGFTLLFFSLTTTMLAFIATILLTIRLEKHKWSSNLIYCAAFFPVTLFGLMQFPSYTTTKDRLKELWKRLKKLLPSRFTKSTKRIERRL